MKSVVERNIFVGYTVEATSSVSVTHLQFADDTLILGTKCWANVRAMRAVLVLFEAMSGLKVNFNKSMLVGVQWRSQEFYRAWAKKLSQNVTSFLRIIAHFLRI